MFLEDKRFIKDIQSAISTGTRRKQRRTVEDLIAPTLTLPHNNWKMSSIDILHFQGTWTVPPAVNWSYATIEPNVFKFSFYILKFQNEWKYIRDATSKNVHSINTKLTKVFLNVFFRLKFNLIKTVFGRPWAQNMLTREYL